jgi:Kdo2-lipid IVA lauroyltransferase/acyltransferase
MFLTISQLPKISLNLSKFLQMRGNTFIFRFLPFWLSRWYLIILGRLYYFLNRKEKELIRTAITRVFGRKMTATALKDTIDETFRGICDHYHEKLFVAYSHFQRLLKFLRRRIRLVGAEALEEALQSGKGVILVTGHFGAVEFLPGCLAVNGYPASMICRFQTNQLRESLGQRAEWVGLDLIDADDGNIILAALKALKQGRILITECDEFDEWRPDGTRHTYFLNSRLSSDRSLELLRKRSGAQVITALVTREGYKDYTLNLTPIGNGSSPAAAPASEQCLSTLEAMIEAHPAQWYQWKKFGKMTQTPREVEHDRQASGYLAPELEVSFADQA